MATDRLDPVPALELWAGVECTVNRVGDRFVDQLRLGGHAERESDLDRLAWLGVPAVRYPVLWERVAPDGLQRARWDWPDRRLGRLRDLGIRPIVGLLHHGSGPRDTSLVDPSFPDKLARYARAVAERYPWVTDWTPINEPLTTARFSTLYGLWYPHLRSFPAFVRALLNQCLGTARAMAEIRAVNPGARLIQTEDFSRIHSTPRLAARAEMDRRLRLLSLDLLTGLVRPDHPLWKDLLAAGARTEEIRAIAEASGGVDLIGVNYYVTSDRFLDHRLGDYPAALHGGDGVLRYCDVESVRCAEDGLAGHRALLLDAWRRYHRPVAITEVHLGCTRDEQLRWLAEAWTGARAARDAGADVRAVTAWAMFGCFGWERLATDEGGRYEPGLFDVRAPAPRPTALAHAVRALARGRSYQNPALRSPGWWRRRDRVVFPSPADAGAAIAPRSPIAIHAAAPAAQSGGDPDASTDLLVTGAAGTLGRALTLAALRRGLRVAARSRRELDVTDGSAVAGALRAIRPWAVINAAGYVRVDDAESQRERCWRENVVGAANVASAARDAGARLVTFSSDLVFDGRAAAPYDEEAATRPLNIYGRSKAAAEERVLQQAPHALVIRTAAFFGPWDDHNFVTRALVAIAAGTPVSAADDVYVSPTYVPDLADAVLDLLFDGAEGLWHIVNRGTISWCDFARRAAAAAGLSDGDALVLPTSSRELGWRARRPAYSPLCSRRGELLGALDDAIGRFVGMTAERLGISKGHDPAGCLSGRAGRAALRGAS